mgnify:CR=1 FL=1
MLNVYNKSDKKISEMIKGVNIIIPPKSSTMVSEKKAEIICKRNENLSMYKKRQYSEEDVAAVKNLNKPQLLDFCLKLMAGTTPSVPRGSAPAEKDSESDEEESDETPDRDEKLSGDSE